MTTAKDATPHLEPCIPLPLSDSELSAVVEKAKDWALMHGVGMRNKKRFSKDSLDFAPFALTPSAFPRSEFDKAVNMQPILNELTHKVAHDDEFLKEALATTLAVDDFTFRLYTIWEIVRKEGIKQPISLGMLRSDIMLETNCPNLKKCKMHSPYCCWKQVEINSIASGFGHLGPTISTGLYRSDYLLHEAAENCIKQVEINTVASSFGGIATVLTPLHSFIMNQLGHGDKIKDLPKNDALNGLCSGLTAAWDIFNVSDAIILFIIEDVTYNICDQRFHEFEIYEKRPEIRVVRKNLTEMSKQAVLNEDKQLIVDGQLVAVVYYRAGYEPGHYPTEKEWEARLSIERSTAIKCPSIQYHLAGTKKVQQTLARPGTLERFIKDPEKVGKVREIFTGLYSLDFDEFGEQAVKMAMDNAERFVLKPQREGGGNNIYGAEIRTALQRFGNSPERTAYILMERISPPICPGYIVRPGQSGLPPVSRLVSELGIFGVIIGTASDIMVNRQVGHMLRTKLSDADEGGVAAGLGALDSPYLVDL
ncbi:glutathione synthetase-like isoform X1 [Arctopsyche grandis]|uniref:glutathione synthetase-like isoform X1 n=1 Tax=Arctopsyche grandis TaxID=121162 RepID=UPI00406DA3AF